MTATSATGDGPEWKTIRVWDPIVRLAHWGIVIAFFTAYLTGDELPGLHTWAGYTVAVLVLVRLVWGIVGTRHARFASFVRGPAAVLGYLRGLLSGKAERHLGHNPAGAAMIVALLISLAGTAGTGMALLALEKGEGPLAGIIAVEAPGTDTDLETRRIEYDDDDHDEREEHGEYGESETGEVMESLHSAFVYLTLVLAGLHVIGVIASSLAHGENLVRAMITGRKPS